MPPMPAICRRAERPSQTKMAMNTSSGSRLSSTDPIEVCGPTALTSTSLSFRSWVNSSSWRLVG